jgi:hypothetical protein
MNVGLIVANLPACRPLLDTFVSHVSSSKGHSRERSYGITVSGATGKTLDRYVELQEQGNAELETRIFSRQNGDNASEMDVDHVDDRSQKRMLRGRDRSDTLTVQVTRDITVTVSDGK